MAYEKTTWVDGDVITAEKLNKIEDGIEDATGYDCKEEPVVLLEESVVTESYYGSIRGTLSYSHPIKAETIIVTFDGVDYVLNNSGRSEDVVSYYGACKDMYTQDYSEYPFGLSCFHSSSQNFLFTEKAGTYSIKISAVTDVVSTTENFKKAVDSLVSVKNIKDAESFGIKANNVSGNTASGKYSFASGSTTVASGECSHSEGVEGTTASGRASHAEGDHTTASGRASHSEGSGTVASGGYSHSEGSGSGAEGEVSHAEGIHTTASGYASHSQGEYTEASGYAQTVIGRYNITQGNSDSVNSTDYAFIIGNGTSSNAPSNALAVKWDGTFVFADGTEITVAQFKSLLGLLNS